MAKNKNALAAACGFVMMLLMGTFYAWSLFRAPLTAKFTTWTAANVSLNFTLFIIFFCLGGMLGGKLLAKLGNQLVICLGAALILIGSLLFSMIGGLSDGAALAVVYVSYGGVCGIGIGMAYNAIISGVCGRFPQSAGLVSGILLTGFGFGSLFIGALLMKLADSFGFFTAFRVTMIVIAVCLAAGSFTLRGAAAVKKAPESKAELTGCATAQMLKKPVFWLFFVWAVFITSTGLMVINSAATIAAGFGVAASLGMIVSLFNGFSRIGIGAFFDKKGSAASMLAANLAALLSGVLMVLAAFTSSVALMFAGLIIAGITYGCGMALNASVIRDLFGSKHYATNFSAITLTGIPASLIGPFVSGLLQDASGGQYLTTYVAMICFGVLALGLYIAMTFKIKKEKGE